MRTRSGRAPVGLRAVHKVKSIRSKNYLIVRSISKNGAFRYKLMDKSFNKNFFIGFLKSLIKNFASKSIKNINFIMDNVKFHHCVSVVELVKWSGHRLRYLTAYSPFLNPIENMFSQWKENVRRRRLQILKNWCKI